MQSAQINSPRFAYQTATPAVETLEEFRVVNGNYAGSFSGKSKQPLWIAVAMIAAIGGIALGVNLYSDNHVAKINTAAAVSTPSVPSASSAKATSNLPPPVVAPDVTNNPASEPLRPLTKSGEPISAPLADRGKTSEAINAVKSRGSVAAKSAVVTPKKAAPIMVAPANKVAPPQQEIVPTVPPNQEPLPAPAPITEEKLVVPAPAPLPEIPQVEPPKL